MGGRIIFKCDDNVITGLIVNKANSFPRYVACTAVLPDACNYVPVDTASYPDRIFQSSWQEGFGIFEGTGRHSNLETANINYTVQP